MTGQSYEPTVELEGAQMTFDFPGFAVGTAEYGPGLTGCTVFTFERKTMTAVDVRGGDPAVSEFQRDGFDAVCFAGGSMQGLEVLSGVRKALFEEFGPDRDLVTCAAVNDWYERDQNINPDKKLGYAAYHAARPNQFLLGPHGAGANVWVGGGKGRGVGEPERAGQGAAFSQHGVVKLSAFVVINALGALVDRQGNVVCGNLDPETGERSSYLSGLRPNRPQRGGSDADRSHTTLTMVITNQTMTYHELRQTGRQVHSSMARAIQPFHTVFDGDVLYMASTGDVEDPELDAVSLGLLASELVWDAALSAIPGR